MRKHCIAINGVTNFRYRRPCLNFDVHVRCMPSHRLRRLDTSLLLYIPSDWSIVWRAHLVFHSSKQISKETIEETIRIACSHQPMVQSLNHGLMASGVSTCVSTSRRQPGSFDNNSKVVSLFRQWLLELHCKKCGVVFTQTMCGYHTFSFHTWRVDITLPHFVLISHNSLCV